MISLPEFTKRYESPKTIELTLVAGEYYELLSFPLIDRDFKQFLRSGCGLRRLTMKRSKAGKIFAS